MMVLIRCPKTGRHLSTGIETSLECFELLADVQPPVKCPFCNKEHTWTKRQAILAQPNRWSEVPEIEDCFIKANENAERAARAIKVEDRALYHRMERKWLGLADGYRYLCEIEQRHGLSRYATRRRTAGALESPQPK